MSLSQKHPGLVLVPWFNVAEWRQVSNLIYSEEISDWLLALERLKIWKLRIPLLSAGVEGTLIILESLLVDANKLSEYELIHIYSMSLLRFLNIVCAATSEKQGTFYKSAKESDIPKWLVSVRHDIAHGSTLPTKSVLLSSLQFCLNWLKEKYWNVQKDLMQDFCVNQAVPESFTSVVDAYTFLNYNLFFGEDEIKHLIGEEYWVKIHQEVEETINVFYENNRKLQQNSKRLLETLVGVIKNGILMNPEWALEKLNSRLIEQHFMLSNHLNSSKFAETKKEEFLSIWSELLTIMYETRILDSFILTLFKLINDNTWGNYYKELAALWIRELFKDLNKLHAEEDSEYLKIEDKKEDSFLYRNKSVLNTILDEPSSYSLTFLEQLLIYYNKSQKYIDNVIHVTKIYVRMEKPLNVLTNGRIYTLQDIDAEMETCSIAEPINTVSVSNNKTTRWRRIEDISQFKNLPLGVLHTQYREKNPFLDS